MDTTALARLQGAIDQWEVNTSFNPHYEGTANFKVYRDGTEPCGDGRGFLLGEIAVTCVYADFKHIPNAPPDENYYDIYHVDTYAQSDAGLQGDTAFNRFWYGSGQSPYSGDLDFQGTMTHELGHWIRLEDLGPLHYTNCNYGTGMYTMCGEITGNGEVETYRQRSLTSDDIAAANLVY